MAAKLAVTVILFLFAFASARTDVVFPGAVENLPRSDPKSNTDNLLLPSEKPESESESDNVVEIQPEQQETEPREAISESEAATKQVPLTFISFRPVNRHFPRRPFFAFRRGHRCRHHKPGGMMKPWMMSQLEGPREISYGKDMILSGGEQIPAKWEKFEPKLEFGHDFETKEGEMKMMPYGRHHHHHHHNHQMKGEEEEHHHHHHEHEGGFMGKIRKFLDHHF